MARGKVSELEDEQHVVKSSLDRLKALDSLSSLGAQLNEIQQLCTHAARADMIIRWLIAKIHTEETAALEPRTWSALLASLRIVPPDRIAGLLSNHDLLERITIVLTLAGVEEKIEDEQLFPAICRVMHFLLDAAEQPTGANLKSLLAVQASAAAKFMGTWLDYMPDFLFVESQNEESVYGAGENYHWTLKPAVAIWESRKRTTAEHEFFADSCLAPVMRTLMQKPLKSLATSTKRKREDTGTTQARDCVHALERLVAKHTLAPARMSFFKSQSSSRDSFVVPDHVLPPNEHLVFFTSALEDAHSVGNVHEDILSDFLRLAVRSSQTGTAQQRKKERPWIEAVFNAMCACNQDEGGFLAREGTAIRLLAAVGDSSLLSEASLEHFVHRYCNLDRARDEPIRWRVVAQVTKINANVFADIDTARNLFVNITSGVLETPLALTQSGLSDKDLFRAEPGAEPAWMQATWKLIVTRVMQAFAQRRDITSFVELWSTQLLVDEHNKYWSVWTSLEKDFSTSISTHADEAVIIELMDAIISRIASAAGTTKRSTAEQEQAQLNADVVIMNAMLASLSARTIQTTFAERLEPLFRSLVQLAGRSSEPEVPTALSLLAEHQFWKLMRKVFEMWLPLELVSSNDSNTADESAIVPLALPAARNALAAIRTCREQSAKSRNKSWIGEDARLFVASVCSGLTSDKMDLDSAGLPLVEQLFEEFRAQDVHFLVQYPHLLLKIRPETRRRVIATFFEPPTETRLWPEAVKSLVEFLCAKTDCAEELVNFGLHQLERDCSEGQQDERSAELATFAVLQACPPKAIPRLLREEILNILCDYSRMSATTGSVDISHRLPARLQLFVHLLRVPNPNAAICTDPTMLWRLAKVINDSDLDKAADPNKHWLYLQEMANLILGYLFDTQDQEKSRDTLVAFSKHLAEHIEVRTTKSGLDELSWRWAWIESMAIPFEKRAKDRLRPLLSHRNVLRQCVRKLGSRLVKGLNVTKREALALVKTRWLLPVMRFLVAIPYSLHDDSMRSLVDIYGEQIYDNLFYAYWDLDREPIANGDVETAPKVPGPWKPALLLWLKIGFNFGSAETGARFAQLATDAVSLGMQPAQIKGLETALESSADRLRPDQRIDLLEATMKTAMIGNMCELDLVRIVISKLDDQAVSPDLMRKRAVYSSLLSVMAEFGEVFRSRAAAECIVTALKQKPFIMNQYLVEATVGAVYSVVHDQDFSAIIFEGAYSIMSVLFLQYRARLQGRYHLLVELFQQMIATLLNAPEPDEFEELDQQDLDDDPRIKCARRLSKLLALFCSPPQSYRDSQGESLVDEARKEQAHVGQCVQYVLHFYCTQVLKSIPPEPMKGALKQGVWSAIEAIQMNSADGIKSLSASMNNSERAILRTVYDDWKRNGKWRGG